MVAVKHTGKRDRTATGCAPLQKLSPGGCTIYMLSRNCHRWGLIVSPRDTLFDDKPPQQNGSFSDVTAVSVKLNTIRDDTVVLTESADACVYMYLDEQRTAKGGHTKSSCAQASVTQRLKNEMNQQDEHELTEQLNQLTSQCQASDVDELGTLDKTLVRQYYRLSVV